MKSDILGVLDSAFISRAFIGGGGVNSQEIMPRLAREYDIVYFPKTAIGHKINDGIKENIMDNVGKIEDFGITVSNEFKSLFHSYNKYDNSNFIKFRNELISRYRKEIGDLSILYDNDFHVPLFPSPLFKGEMYELSKYKNRTKFGITLRGFGAINLQNNLRIILHILKNEKLTLNPRLRGKYISLAIGPFAQHAIVSNLIWKGNVDFIGYVNSELVDLFSLTKDHANLYDLYPADASRFASIKRKMKIKNQLVFFGRLVPEKGIFEIPRIAKHLKNLGINCHIKVIGKFTFDHEEHIFNNLKESLGVDDMIDYLGFLPEEQMADVIGSSSIFINPTHSDTYSIAMLEALSSDVVVVAYSIPFLKRLYSNVKAVEFVKEYDTRAMALKIAKLLTYESGEFQEFFDKQTREFVSDHSSYDVITGKIAAMIGTEMR